LGGFKGGKEYVHLFEKNPLKIEKLPGWVWTFKKKLRDWRGSPQEKVKKKSVGKPLKIRHSGHYWEI